MENSIGNLISAQLAKLLQSARRIFVFTGAGISTESGIPDFRGPSGVWKTRQPVTWQEFMASEEKRREYWEWKLEGYDIFAKAEPTKTHKAIAALEKAGRLALLVTQNVDGLHEKAGNTREKLVEIHGTNHLVQCMTCWEKFPPEPHYRFFNENRTTPRCDCGGLLKPATISFGQNLVQEDMDRAADGARRSDLAISLGSTLAVYPAAHFPILAADGGTPYVIINRGTTDHDNLEEVTLRLDGNVDDIFPPAVEAALKTSP